MKTHRRLALTLALCALLALCAPVSLAKAAEEPRSAEEAAALATKTFSARLFALDEYLLAHAKEADVGDKAESYLAGDADMDIMRLRAYLSLYLDCSKDVRITRMLEDYARALAAKGLRGGGDADPEKIAQFVRDATDETLSIAANARVPLPGCPGKTCSPDDCKRPRYTQNEELYVDPWGR